jgi:hypothetical protein
MLCLQQTGEIDNRTISWGKVLGCVVCRFHVVVGAKLCPGRGAIYKLFGVVAKLASINLRKSVLSPTGSINLGFILREDLLLCSSYLPLGFPTGRSSTRHQDSKCRVLSIGKLDFPHKGDSRVYIKLSGNCVYKDPFYPSSNNLQGKINLLCALILPKWLSSTRCV